MVVVLGGGVVSWLAGGRAGDETQTAFGHGVWAVTDDHSPEEDQLSVGLNKDTGAGVGGTGALAT